MNRKIEGYPIWTDEQADKVLAESRSRFPEGDQHSERVAFELGAYFFFRTVAEDLWILEGLRK